MQPRSHADGMPLTAVEERRDLRVLAVRDGGRERWRPACPERLEAGQDVLVACSREAWERLRALTVA